MTTFWMNWRTMFDERLLRFRVSVLAHVIEGRVDDQFDGFRADFRLQLPDLLLEIHLRRRLLQPRLEAGATLLKHVEHIVEGGEARASLGSAIADLLNNLALFLLGSLQLPGNALALVGLVPDGRSEVAARVSGDVVEHAHAEEGGGEAQQNPVLQVPAQDGLLVGAARAAEAIDRQLALVIGAAVVFLGYDGVGSAALGAFQHATQQVAWSMRLVSLLVVVREKFSSVVSCRSSTLAQSSSLMIRKDGTSVTTHSLLSLRRAVRRSVSGFLR